MKDLSWIKTGYFAHRGLYNNKAIPENTIKAFEEAAKHGYDIELDIRETKDGNLVVFHDKNMHRLCGVNLKLKDYLYKEINHYKILETDQTIPLLKDVLKSIPTNVKLLIEFKPMTYPKLMVNKFMTLMRRFDHQYAIHSYDPRIVHAFKKLYPAVIRGQIAETFPNEKGFKPFFLKRLFFNFWTKPDFINYRFEDLPRKQLDKLKSKGMVILSFSARSEEDLAFVKKHYDNAVFEHFYPKKEQ
jgi:glycerophosphoryl diester phosphodiesterase